MNVNKLIFLVLLATTLLTSTSNAQAFGQTIEPMCESADLSNT